MRSFVKPGITGLAQVRGFRGEAINNTDMENRVACDLEYLENWNLSLECGIIVRTVRAALHSAANCVLNRTHAISTGHPERSEGPHKSPRNHCSSRGPSHSLGMTAGWAYGISFRFFSSYVFATHKNS